ncbi:hypothetical protein L6452_43257 [Arctium lappa]|uniref:Uncharacterized protein n=1 Tax=Arctium lappa TaxID=4217 RepID=A0ACB8XK00_ARCLA|nr:hypothetical protein L6452_43257 [Arctium lappa]
MATPLQQVPSLLEKKKVKLKELRKRRKGGWPATQEEVELLLGFIDVKVISRVLTIRRRRWLSDWSTSSPSSQHHALSFCSSTFSSSLTLTPYLKLTMRNPQTIANECGQTVRKCVADLPKLMSLSTDFFRCTNNKASDAIINMSA